jgi:hypothetical protein
MSAAQNAPGGARCAPVWLTDVQVDRQGERSDEFGQAYPASAGTLSPGMAQDGITLATERLEKIIAAGDFASYDKRTNQQRPLTMARQPV